jgi:hypothetical protein
MNRTCLLLLSSALATAAMTRAQTPTFPLVAPTSATGTEGATSTAIPFGSTLARHVLYAYGGDAVGYATPIRIGAIELRADGATPGGSVAGSYNFTLSCSTGVNAPNALSTTFAANHGGDRILVRTGALAVPAPAVGQLPNDFSLHIPFTTPFEWDPRNGPLLLDFAYNAATPAFGAWDAEGAPNSVGGLAANGAATATATSVLTTAPVLRLLAAADATPAAFANTEATTSSAFPWNRAAGTSMRTLNLYEGAVMPFTGRRLITALAWRTDAGAAFGGRTYDVRISLSTSSNTATTMNNTFAANHGSDLTVVFDGTLVCGASPASPDLSQFDVFCELQRPFEYDPVKGALAVDIQLRGSTGATTANFDTTSQTGLQVARLSDPSSSTSTTGTSNQPGIALVMAIRSVPVPVLPAQLANTVNPNSNNTSFPWGSSPCRTLGMVSAVAAGITQPTFVRSLRFRPSLATTFGPCTQTCTIDLSTPTNTPVTASATFDLNHGSNRLRVFDGQFSVPFGIRTATDTGFPIEVKLQRPFLWDPSTHPYLSIDIVVTNRIGPGIQVETTNGLTVDDARQFIASATATSATPQQIAFVVQIGGEQADGLAVNYGAGCAGTNGTPLCTTVGLPSLPNPDFKIRLRNGPGNALGFLLVGFAAANLPIGGAPGCQILHGIEFGTFGIVITDPTGDGSLAFPLGNTVAFEGFPFRTQWVCLDPGVNAIGLTTSDAQVVTMKFF